MHTGTTNCEPAVSQLLTGALPQSLHPIAQGRFCFYQLLAVSALFYSSAYKPERETNGGYTVRPTKVVVLLKWFTKQVARVKESETNQ